MDGESWHAHSDNFNAQCESFRIFLSNMFGCYCQGIYNSFFCDEIPEDANSFWEILADVEGQVITKTRKDRKILKEIPRTRARQVVYPSAMQLILDLNQN